ncbi:uncharacterized protein [Rutidosis leptorrhynchoides]|uniref:uncharacterized protein n=1 Tax=Rutidosis leptorrhynchoides TaxID=125765 RepID=UPI003A99C810
MVYQANPDNAIGILTMGNEDLADELEPTSDLDKILNHLKSIWTVNSGDLNLSRGILTSMTNLKYLGDPSSQKRILIFTGGPTRLYSGPWYAKMLKGEGIAVDVVDFCLKDYAEKTICRVMGQHEDCNWMRKFDAFVAALKVQHLVSRASCANNMSDLQVVGGIKKLNNQNYNTWKWKVKVGKAMFVLKTTIEEEVLEHIRAVETPKEAWDTLEKLFSKKNDTKLQLLESELLSIKQRDMKISEYFYKVKSLCREISELDAEERIGERSGVVDKTDGRICVKAEEKALYFNKSKWNSKYKCGTSYKKNDDKVKTQESNSKGTRLESSSSYQTKGKKYVPRCYNCQKRGHLARDCRAPKNEEVNTAQSREGDEWDVEALMVTEEDDEVSLSVSKPNKLDHHRDWIVDSGCSNHMTGDIEKLKNMVKYNGSKVVVTANNSKLSIAHVGDTTVLSSQGESEVSLQNVYHVPGMKKNLYSVPQVTSSGKFVLFGPEDVKVYERVQVIGEPVMMGKRKESVYVMSVEEAYVDKTRKSETVDLWHSRLSHFGYDKLEIMMKKSLLKGLPKLEVKKEVVCDGCQFGKAHQLQNKSETLDKFKIFKRDSEAEIGERVGCLRTDNGGEYVSSEFTSFLRECKVRHQFTCSNTPQQNGVSERKNRHLAEVCRSMMHSMNVPRRFWAEAM